jgi:L-ectoine synthase
MKVVKVSGLEGSKRAVRFPCGMVSNRILLESDGMGYTLTKTEIPKGDWRYWHYKNHLETCYCISGRGVLHDLDTDEKYHVYPDVAYILDKHDRHKFKATEDTVLICVFNPPLTGMEVHGKDGSYPGPDTVPRPVAKEMQGTLLKTSEDGG